MTFKERLQEAVAIQAQRSREVDAAMRANNGPAQPGDLFLFPGMPDGCYLGFAIISTHPDNKGCASGPATDDLFLMAPVDIMGSPLVGLTDVVEQNYYYNRVVVHCGYCFWFARADIDKALGQPASGVGRAELRKTDECRLRVAAMARGKYSGTAEQRATEDNPDYQEDQENVAFWVAQLCMRIRGYI